MKREFLKELGIEDKATIDKILNENSADIGRAKEEVDDLKSQNAQLQSQLDKKTSEYDALKESTKDYEEVTSKNKQLEADVAKVTAEKKQLEVDVDAKVSTILKIHAVENSARDAKAKNVKAVMALLDMEKITYKDGTLSGATEQFDALKSGEDTSFLFGETQSTPKGTHINNPPYGGNGGNPPTAKSFAEAVANAIGK